MLDIVTSARQEYVDLGRELWLEKDKFRSFEQASQFIVKQIFDTFTDSAGNPEFALVRIFRLTDVAELPDDVRAHVSRQEKRVMALMGTWGGEPAWQDRRRSQGHQAIPLSQIAVPQQIPMFQAVLTQLGINLQQFFQTKELDLSGVKLYQGSFFIPDATSPVLPAQSNFVQPYGIKALVGFGGLLGSEGAFTLYLLYAFSTVKLSPDAALAFCALQEFVGAFLASTRRIFAD